LTFDADGLTFEGEVNDDITAKDTINSTDLRASSSTPFDNGLHFTMVLQWTVQPACVPAPMQPRRLLHGGRKAALHELAPDPPPPVDAIFEIPVRVDDHILCGCWLGSRWKALVICAMGLCNLVM